MFATVAKDWSERCAAVFGEHGNDERLPQDAQPQTPQERSGGADHGSGRLTQGKAPGDTRQHRGAVPATLLTGAKSDATVVTLSPQPLPKQSSVQELRPHAR